MTFNEESIANERLTENIVREFFRKNKKDYDKVKIYEQIPESPRIQKLLKNASKGVYNQRRKPKMITKNDFPIYNSIGVYKNLSPLQLRETS